MKKILYNISRIGLARKDERRRTGLLLLATVMMALCTQGAWAQECDHVGAGRLCLYEDAKYHAIYCSRCQRPLATEEHSFTYTASGTYGYHKAACSCWYDVLNKYETTNEACMDVDGDGKCDKCNESYTSSRTFDFTLTDTDGGASVLSHKGATKVSFTNADKKVTMKVQSGKNDANPVTMTLEHLVKYELDFLDISIKGGSGTPEGTGPVWAGVQRRRAQQSSTLIPEGPALVFEGADSVHYLNETPTELQYIDGKYLINGNVVEGTVTGVYYYDPAQNGVCQHGQYESAPLVTAQNYASLGLTSAYVGYYAVQNYGQLYWLSQKSTVYPYVDASVVLTADIIYDKTLKWDSYIKMSDGKVFDGNGHSIRGIVSSYYGVFHAISSGCTVKNLGIKSIKVSSGNEFLGGLCATNSGSIINCYVDGANITVISFSAIKEVRMSALCVENDGEIKNCYAKNTNLKVEGSVTEETYTGAICGVNNESGKIYNCHASGKVCGNNMGITYCCKEYVSDERFASGEMAWLLNSSVNNGDWTAGPVDGTQAWYQDLSEGGDGSPVLKSTGSNTVYKGYVNCEDYGYANTALSATPLAHADADKNGYCDRCVAAVDVTLTLSRVGDRYYTSFGAPYIYKLSDVAPANGVSLNAYVASSAAEGTLTMKAVGSQAIAAGKGIVIVGTDDTAPATMTATIAHAESAEVGDKDILEATTAGMDPNGNAFFSAVDGIVGFYGYDTQYGAVPARKAYLPVSVIQEYGVKGFVLMFEDEDDATSIHNAQCTMHNEAGAVYNLQGQRLTAPQKGINIVNGKKVFR